MKFILLLAVLAVTSPAQAEQSQKIEPSQISEITFERTPCYGRCPCYKVTLRPDGTILYEGKQFVDKIGLYRGHLCTATNCTFAKLARMLISLRFFNLKDDYSIEATDGAATITTATVKGKEKRVRNYMEAGPDELWTIEMMIDGIVKNNQFEKEKTQ